MKHSTDDGHQVVTQHRRGHHRCSEYEIRPVIIIASISTPCSLCVACSSCQWLVRLTWSISSSYKTYKWRLLKNSRKKLTPSTDYKEKFKWFSTHAHNDKNSNFKRSVIDDGNEAYRSHLRDEWGKLCPCIETPARELINWKKKDHHHRFICRNRKIRDRERGKESKKWREPSSQHIFLIDGNFSVALGWSIASR